ncbi:M28 family peptidase [Robiginitalea sp. M366]|uniref:M28 family peptidase n=1 Tax=Robiginitalea aestuariiviva TaxID=3036903 RepID=UPI00240DC689|nr:M28 family peptidase [Robiginitalea aestuariiviva]MDG1572799.1 M28 family peptidase [Robiginitalea aestuariiviva]
MYRLTLLLAGLALACNSSQPAASQQADAATQPPKSVQFASSITAEELREHLYTYASDDFQGRETGTEGQKKAASYLREAYKELGIPPARGTEDYFQKVPLELAQLPGGTIEVGGQSFTNGEDFLTFTAGTGGADQIVYVGYGIETDTYSDYANQDVNGKIVLMKAGEPRAADGTYVLSGTDEASPWSNMSEAIGLRSEVAQAKGASAMFMIDPDNFSRYKRYYDNMRRNNSGQMNLKSQEQPLQVVLLQDDMATALFPGWNAASAAAPVDVALTLKVESENQEVDSENVVAFLKGSTYPDQYVVISSHLDHIGVNSDGEINNGADDDGSGSVAMLEIAEAFKKAADAGVGPKRSIIFLHVTGEEKGLLGSRYYTDEEPLYPLEQTVADLNIDMIGRTDPKREGSRNYVYLIGSDKLSSELHELSEAVNEKYAGLELDYTYNDENDPNRFYYRSDHYNFAKNNIPIIFYFNGTHVDYHRPGDTPDKIEYDLLQDRSRLIFLTAWEVANRDARLQVDKVAR